jgi:phosphomannomutase
MSDLKSSFPQYTISKNKLALTKSTNIDLLLEKISYNYKNVKQNKIDGLKLEFENEWVHMRKSNTEPIIRIYAESQNQKSAHNLGKRFVEELKSLI